jgi:tetratricopeptide (TPR) repeat protein
MCFGFICHGSDAIKSGNYGKAEACFRLAEKQAASMPPGQAQDFALFVQCHRISLRHHLGQTEEAKKLHETAMAQLDENQSQMEAFAYPHSMAKALMQLGEHRRAIPFCERAVLEDLQSKDPTAVVGSLAALAHCFGYMGLKDHSAVPAKAALKILRDYPGDPRLAGVLIALGNALRKSSPAEAESLYKEAVEFHESKAHLESATPAWNNLGTLCSEQGRLTEALEYYKKALHVREQLPSTPLANMGRLLNNMANCYRRMGEFAEAHRLLDRAIHLLKLAKQDGTRGLVSAYGTRGLILKDEGRDAEAVEMFQLSYAESKSMPSPDFGTIVEHLEGEIAVLKRMGKLEEEVLAEGRLASVNAEQSKFQHVDRDLSSHIEKAEGSVSVEIGYGSRPGSRYGKQDLDKLLFALVDAVENANAGFCGGSVTTPESTTWMFYSGDAEALLQAMQPLLKNQKICQGASLSIRQGKEIRQVILSGTVM